MNSLLNFSIVLPCYNEADNLDGLLSRFLNSFENYSDYFNEDNFELLLVNNGSNDNSAFILEKWEKRINFMKVISLEINHGYGYGILMGLNRARFNYLGWTHADLQTDPNDVFKALLMIINNSVSKKILIKGRRIGRPLFDRFFTKGMSIFESLFLGLPLHDINAQPNIFDRSLFEMNQDPPHDFSFDLYYYAKALILNYHIIRFDVKFNERIYGISKSQANVFDKIKFIMRTLNYSRSLRRNLKH